MPRSKQIGREELEERVARKLFVDTRERARREGVRFELTEDWFLGKIRAGRCEATGMPFDLQDPGDPADWDPGDEGWPATGEKAAKPRPRRSRKKASR